MSILKNGDSVIDDPKEIAKHVVKFYSNLYVVSNNCQENDLIRRVVPELVSLEDNKALTKMPSKEEIKQAIFDMNGEGAPSPDGFGGCFYQTFWEIISHDVCRSVLFFFERNWIKPCMNSNSVVSP